MRLSGERVRVSTRLLEGASGELLWAERFDREYANVFAIQDQITEAVVQHLELELMPEERQAIQQARTDSVEAYHYELRGRQLALALTKSNLLLARSMFAKAAELDSGYARAYAGMVICDCYLREWHGQKVPAGAILPIADKAVDLDAGLPEAHTARGFALFCNEKYDDADRSYRQALSINPNSYDANFFFASTIVRFRNDRERMVSLFKLAARLRPDDYVSPMMIAGFLGKNDPERLEWARACVERAERAVDLYPENASPLHRGAVALAYLGDGGRPTPGWRALLRSTRMSLLQWSMRRAFMLSSAKWKTRCTISKRPPGKARRTR
ncbi:adenylate cyclase (plasmid) [Sinorhizobium americanum CCGM7]|uniref:tetratricopeptide repeat protein n=1 Tax=Sinorhizobium americanum TaxID=194963 RepID=UPI0004D7BD86|nr:tetratricopeptide repeat protein [Sinorhizobium americanum]APG86691.1 adenylate cyclase [Sinorhizobium americanum CCGM7]